MKRPPSRAVLAVLPLTPSPPPDSHTLAHRRMQGAEVDYAGAEVTVEAFVRVLTGACGGRGREFVPR